MSRGSRRTKNNDATLTKEEELDIDNYSFLQHPILFGMYELYVQFHHMFHTAVISSQSSYVD